MRTIIWQNLVLILLTNIIIDVTYLISGIYTNFQRLLCKMRDVGYHVVNHGVTKLMLTVSISLLHKILNTCQK